MASITTATAGTRNVHAYTRVDGQVDVEDTTNDLADIAARRRDARAEHAKALREIEGHAAFEGRQRFFDIVATLAREHRLSRFAYTAEMQA
jgi:hypothetical protein